MRIYGSYLGVYGIPPRPNASTFSMLKLMVSMVLPSAPMGALESFMDAYGNTRDSRILCASISVIGVAWISRCRECVAICLSSTSIIVHALHESAMGLPWSFKGIHTRPWVCRVRYVRQRASGVQPVRFHVLHYGISCPCWVSICQPWSFIVQHGSPVLLYCRPWISRGALGRTWAYHGHL